MSRREGHAQAAGPVAERSLAAPAPAGLLFAPETWQRPLSWLAPLSTFIAGADADSPLTLYIDGRGPDLEPWLVRSLLGAACTHLAGTAPFASVALLEGDVEVPAGSRRVTSAGEIREHLGLPAPELPNDPGETVERARQAKALVDALQSAIDRELFEAAPRPDLRDQPLVTVRIPTYGRTDGLVQRSIPSVLAGAYENVEIVVCSDGPQPETRSAVEAITDPRVRYLELETRPAYPSRPEAFWQVAGAHAVNRALDDARGALIAPLDHDDAFTYDHIPKLLDALRDSGADFVYGQAMTEYPEGEWRLLGSEPLTYGEIVHASVLYTARLAHLRYDPQAWLVEEPGDWNLWRRMRACGAAIHHLPEPVAVHFRERSSIGHRQRGEDVSSIEAMAHDLVRTPACALLEVISRGRSS